MKTLRKIAEDVFNPKPKKVLTPRKYSVLKHIRKDLSGIKRPKNAIGEALKETKWNGSQ